MTTPADLRAAAERVKRWLATPGVTPGAARDLEACADAALLLAEARENPAFDLVELERIAIQEAATGMAEDFLDELRLALRRLLGKEERPGE